MKKKPPNEKSLINKPASGTLPEYHTEEEISDDQRRRIPLFKIEEIDKIIASTLLEFSKNNPHENYHKIISNTTNPNYKMISCESSKIKDIDATNSDMGDANTMVIKKLTNKKSTNKQSINKNLSNEKDTNKNSQNNKKINVRCQKNIIRLDNKKHKVPKYILNTQMEASKSIYNQGLYCQRLWYSRAHKKIIQHYISNIHKYIYIFSTRDKTYMFEELIRMKDRATINILLLHVRSYEKDVFIKLLEKAKNIMKSTAFTQMQVYDIPEEKYVDDLKSIILDIGDIGIDNFTDQYGSYKDFMEMLIDAINITINNKEKTRQNPKRSRNKKRGNNTIKKRTTISSAKQKHLIPPSYLDKAIVEQYVKDYFEKKAIIPQDDSYKMIGSQVAQQTLHKLDDAYDSFFKKLEKYKIKRNIDDKRPNPPHYRKNKYVLVFQNKSFKIVTINNKTKENKKNKTKKNKKNKHKNGKYVKLSLGLLMKHKLIKLDENSDGFLWFKLPKNLKDAIIDEIEISPSDDKTLCYINYKYKIALPKIDEEQDYKANYKIASVDFGMINLMTIFSLFFDDPIIYKGGYVIYINKFYKRLIEGIYQPALAKAKNENRNGDAKRIEDHIYKLWRRRKHIMHDHFNKISTDFIKKCVYANINEIILGYNKNWKKGTNMGSINNDNFCKIPYRNLINMIFHKARKNGIKVRENEESYTSKCDALNWEEIGYHEVYNGKRLRRGLFSAGNDALINADVNGAINIMRKALKDDEEILEKLKEGIRKYKTICNPKVIKIEREKKFREEYIKGVPTKIINGRVIRKINNNTTADKIGQRMIRLRNKDYYVQFHVVAYNRSNIEIQKNEDPKSLTRVLTAT
jgi:IS605 OrfB family transposase